MYYLIYDTAVNDYAIRSFPHEACSLWTVDIKKAFDVNYKMRSHTTITAGTIEEYLQDHGDNTLVVLAVWDTCPSLEQVYLDYPELFI